MGYETRLLIGVDSSLTEDDCVYGDLIIEDGEAYRPIKKDEEGTLLKTGRKATWFKIYASIDLCKCGYKSKINDIDNANNDENHYWYWYEGSERTSEDAYGRELKPISANTVIAALKKDVESYNYRRFKWALALLESMTDDSENISVLLCGY